MFILLKDKTIHNINNNTMNNKLNFFFKEKVSGKNRILQTDDTIVLKSGAFGLVHRYEVFKGYNATDEGLRQFKKFH